METKPRSRPRVAELMGLTEEEQVILIRKYAREYQSWWKAKRDKDPTKKEANRARMRDNYHRRVRDPEAYKRIQEARHRADAKRESRPPGYRSPEQGREAARKHKYGLTQEQFEAMKEAQGNVCKICNHPEIHMKQGKLCELSVDHDHKTGVNRGLLCNNCNRGLGFFKDDRQLLLNAASYLGALWP